MVRDFQTVIGNECLVQMPEAIGRQPDYVVAAVGGGSNAMGIFHPYIPHEDVRLIGVEAAGEGLETGRHAASLAAGTVGVLHGNRTYVMQDADGQVQETHSVSAGLDYPGVGPEHAWLKDSGRAEYVGISDEEALKAFHDCCRIEGIMPALESSHAIAQAVKMAPSLPRDKVILVSLSGRGDRTCIPSPNAAASSCDAMTTRNDRIAAAFARTAASGRASALIPYIAAGDPRPRPPCR